MALPVAFLCHVPADESAQLALLVVGDVEQGNQRVILRGVERRKLFAAELHFFPGFVGLGFAVQRHQLGAAVVPPGVKLTRQRGGLVVHLAAVRRA